MNWPFRRRRHELDEEIRAHLAMAARDRVERGERADTARAAARREFGNVDLVKDVTRDVAGYPRLDRLWGDVRHAFRRIVHRPGTSVAVVLMLGLAVGVATAMFAITDALLLRPVPFREPDRLVRLDLVNEQGGDRWYVSPAVLRAWRESSAFEAAEGIGSIGQVVVGETPVVKVSAAVTPGLFPMLGVHPIRGRLFDSADSGADRILISEEIWRSVLAADPAVAGRTLDVDGQRMEIIGVLPAGVRFPQWNTQIWRALDVTDPAAEPRPLVRLAPGISLADAIAVATDRAHAVDASTSRFSVRVSPVPLVGYGTNRKTAVRVLAGAVLFVFAVLCANVCGLMLVRFSARRVEFALCAALGASRWRLMRQACAESAVLAALGALVGVGLAWMLITITATELPQAFLSQTLHPVSMDARTLVAAVICAGLATLAIGLAPAIAATRHAPASSVTLKEHVSTEHRTARVLGRALLVGQIALACTLLVGTALLVRSFVNFVTVDRGFGPHGLIEVQLKLDRTLTSRPEAHREVLATAVATAADALRSLPGVTRLALSNGGPVTYGPAMYVGAWTSDGADTATVSVDVQASYVSPEFFGVYGIRLLQGRIFDASDLLDDIVIGERLASALWPDGRAIGRRLSFKTWRFHVVGVVAETNRPSLDGRDWADLFMPLQAAALTTTVTLQCGDRCPGEALIRERVRTSGSAAGVYTVTSLEQMYADDAEQPRAAAALGSLFGVIALVVAAAGLFGVLSATVVRRRREFGIRVALGASPERLRRVVFVDAARVAVPGVALGSAAAWSLGRLLSSLQYGVTPHDPASWGMVLVVLGCVTLAAAWLPARDAMRTDPATLLREE